MIRNNDIIQGYTVLMVANGMVLAHSKTAPDPYVVWHTAENCNDVYGGKYQSNKEDAEWDFCCKAFPWFEDNAPVNVIEDESQKRIDDFKDSLKQAKLAIDSAAALVEDMVVEHDKLVSQKKAPQCSPAEQKINKIVAHVTEIIENNSEVFAEQFSKVLSSADDIDTLTKVFGCGFPIRYTAQSIWERCSTKILQDIWDVDTPFL